jgi:hypothetical protein
MWCSEKWTLKRGVKTPLLNLQITEIELLPRASCPTLFEPAKLFNNIPDIFVTKPPINSAVGVYE